MEAVKILAGVFDEGGLKRLKMFGLDGFDFEKTEIIPPFAKGYLIILVDKRGLVRLRVWEDRDGEILIHAYHSPKGRIIYAQKHFKVNEINVIEIDPLKMLNIYA